MLNAIITGANRGIGRALCHQLNRGNYNVTGIDIVNNTNNEYSIIECDVGDEKSVIAALNKANLGNIDCLINCAGVYQDVDIGLEDVTAQQIQETFLVNAFGPLIVTKAIISALCISPNPTVINISSHMGSIEANEKGLSYAYRMSKTALNMFSLNLALEYPNFRVLSVHPGHVKTEIGGPLALISAEESAQKIIQIIMNPAKYPGFSFLDLNGEKIDY